MNAQEIVDELRDGKTVVILANNAFVFMREVERHGIDVSRLGVTMQFENGQCAMAIRQGNTDE